MQPDYVGEIIALKQDIQNTTKERFYSNAIKYRIQLLWMQNLAMRILLWLVVVVNCVTVAIFIIALLTIPDRAEIMPQAAPFVVTVSALAPFIFFFVAATYAAGLLIYGWRVRRSVRRQGTIIPIYDMSLTPVEVAALTGRPDYAIEAWHIVYRLLETRNLEIDRRGDGMLVLRRKENESTMKELRWYEQQVLFDIFRTDKQHQQRLLRSMTPERLDALNIDYKDAAVPLDMLDHRIGRAYLEELNDSIRAQLVRDKVYRPLQFAGMWMQTLLYAMLLATTPFAFLFAYAMLATISWHAMTLQMPSMSVVGVIAAYIITFACCMVWFLSTDIYTRFGLQQYIKAEGMRLYLEVALKDRLAAGELGEKEVAHFLPYAEVLGLASVDPKASFSRFTPLDK